MRSLTTALLSSTLCIAAGTAAIAQFVEYPPSLKSVPVPQPPELAEFVRDHDAAITLGKALFWDMSVGSDRQTACATCHGSAGVDPRRFNVVHPGANGTFDGGVVPGEWKSREFFPTVVFENPASRFSARLRDIDDVVGSPGVLRRVFVENHSKLPIEICDDAPEPPFGDADSSYRQVTGRNAPTVHNAVFNIRNFWDGRANPWFNGVNGLGPIDGKARVWRQGDDGQIEAVRVTLRNASLASQAVMPVLSSVEMSCAGRQLSDLAARLLDERALSMQRVATTDSRLGSLVAPGGVGLTVTYRQMIADAFLPEWHAGGSTPAGTTQIEANFSLFFGLSLQLYQATLVSDDTRYDRWIEEGGPSAGSGPQWLTPQERRGLDIFLNVGQIPDTPIGYCAACHASTVFSSASTLAISQSETNGIELMNTAATARLAQAVFADHPSDDPQVRPLEFALDGARIELMQPGETEDDGTSVPPFVAATVTLPKPMPTECPSDLNYIAPILDADGDLGEGSLFVSVRRRLLASGACGTTLVLRVEGARIGEYDLLVEDSSVALVTVGESGAYDRGFYNIGVRPTAEDLGLGGTQAADVPLSWTRRRQLGLSIPEIHDLAVVAAGAHAAVDGAFKTPGLRNIELTGPYMHNGGQSTLRQVMEFYNRGGDFHDQNILDLSPDMNPLDLTDDDMNAIVAFLLALTDERVRDERGPFDHPELPLPNAETIPPVGAEGRAASCLPPIESFEAMLANPTPPEDCDGDGYLDSCMVLQQPWIDVNRDGTPDSCQCIGDIDRNGAVDAGDLTIVLTAWGTSGGSSGADLNADGVVAGDDLVIILSMWGACAGG